jgi:hypothetical protein
MLIYILKPTTSQHSLYTFVLLICLFIAGCASLPSQSISATQFDYNEHLRYSARSQLLHNIVGLQHHEAPYFLSASSVLSQLSKEGSASAELALGPASDSDLGSLGGSIIFKESPTITYLPLQGESYTRLLLTPLPPPLVLALIESGWPIDLLMQLSVKSINGVRNSKKDDSSFYDLTRLLAEMKANHDFAIKIQKDNQSYQAMFVVNPELTTEGQLRIKRLRSMLKLEQSKSNDFNVIFNEYVSGANELAIVTRSIFEIMTELGAGLKSTTPQEMVMSLRILSDKTPPHSAYAVTHYKDSYYWIEAGDIQSERAFLLTQLLLELNNSAALGVSPILSLGTL